MATLAAFLSLGGWVLGRAFSDRWEWSQYLFWVPSPLVLLAVAALLITSGLLARIVRGLQPADSLAARPPATRTRRLAWGAWLLVAAWVAFGEFHLHRYVELAITPRAAPRLRVMYWNPVETDNLPAHVLATAPDILVIANAPARADWVGVRTALGEPNYTVRFERFSVVSRYPILRWAGTELGIEGAQPRTFIFRGGGYVVTDKGQALLVELDTTRLLGQPTALWAIDLPSDFNLSRWSVMRRAAQTLANFEGPAYTRTPDGLDQPGPLEHGFPAPDLIVGDFNTPRGSASLSEIVGLMPNAYDQAGRGLAATWPRERPLVAIDQAFVGPRLQATEYRVIDFGEGHHRAVLFEVTGREP